MFESALYFFTTQTGCEKCEERPLRSLRSELGGHVETFEVEIFVCSVI